MNGQTMEASHRWLEQALIGYFSPHHPKVERSGCRRWASATFSGGRHSFTLHTAVGNAAQAAAGLADHDFQATDPIVADIRTVSHQCCGQQAIFEIEALTVEGF